MITLYFLQASRSIRIAWLLEELGITDYEIEFADRVNQKAPKEFKEKSGNPLGKFPAIKDDGLTVYESGAIIEYLCAKYDKSHRLIPPANNPELRNKVLIWLHSAEGAFMLHGLALIYADWFLPDKVKQEQPDVLPEMHKGMATNVQNDLDWLEKDLSSNGGRFLVGNEVTVADIMMQFSVDFIFERKLGTEGKSWPKVQEWLDHCKQTETYKRAVERSGYTLHPKIT